VQDLVGRQTLAGYTASIPKPLFHQVFEAHGRTDQCPALKFLEHDLGVGEQPEPIPELHWNRDLTLGCHSHF